MDPAGKLNVNPSLDGKRVGGKGDDELIAKCYGVTAKFITSIDPK